MICPKCKRVISKEDKFCGYCGEKLNFKKEKNDYPGVPDRYRIEHIGYHQKQKDIKHIFSNHWKPALFIIITFLILWSIISDGRREFPQLAQPKNVTFEWEYKGSGYFITETLYKTVYDYYKSSPDKHCWQEEESYEICFKEFLEEAEEDNTISKIASDIKLEALKRGLSNDELVELTIAFVQSIPYDEEKFVLITYSNDPEDWYPVYPYEVLYNNKGVCGGKSFLAASLLEELGYGVALFNYEPIIESEVGHIVPAVKCPKGYSSYSSGYCHSEVTEKGFKIGDIPINIDAGVAQIRTPVSSFEEKNIFNLESELKDAEIYVMADGDAYQGIIDTIQTLQRIETLEKEIDRLYWVINSLEKEIAQLESNMNYYEQQSEAAYRRHLIWQDYDSYNEYSSLYSRYESVHTKYESKFDEYDRKVDQYNNLAYEYNILIEDFYE